MVAILALMILTAAAISLSVAARLELRAAERGVDTVRREAALRGAVNRGVALLETAGSDPEKRRQLLEDHRELTWRPLAPDGEGATASLLTAVQIVDASSRLNLNTADEDQLARLPGIDKEAAAALVDWRSESDKKKGKSDPDYGRGDRPYRTKGRPFDTLEEILLVKGVSPGAFFGAPTFAATAKLDAAPVSELLTVFSGENNTNEDGTARVDVNTAAVEKLVAAANPSGEPFAEEGDRGQLREPRQLVTKAQVENMVKQRKQRKQPYRSVVEALQAAGAADKNWGAVMDRWTVDRRSFVPGRVNVNTAPGVVLQSLGLKREMIDDVLKQRGKQLQGMDWPAVMKTVGFPLAQAYAEESQGQTFDWSHFERLFSVRSSAFLVRCLVKEGGSRRTDAAAALVYLPSGGGSAEIVQWRQPEKFPGWTAWYRTPGESEGLTRGR